VLGAAYFLTLLFLVFFAFAVDICLNVQLWETRKGSISFSHIGPRESPFFSECWSRSSVLFRRTGMHFGKMMMGDKRREADGKTAPYSTKQLTYKYKIMTCYVEVGGYVEMRNIIESLPL
jgi:hypothetical protein